MVNQSDTYVFVMLDLDVPPANGSTTRRVLLHCMNTGFRVTQQQLSGATTLLASSENGPAAYLPPGPPAIDSVAHRYVQLLFPQPSNLSVQTSDFVVVQDRIKFDVSSFMSENGVSAPVAANFFLVDGRDSAEATGTATGSSGVATSTLQSFDGAAAKMDLPYELAGLLSGLALFAI
jgi:hypothetical protein